MQETIKEVEPAWKAEARLRVLYKQQEAEAAEHAANVERCSTRDRIKEIAEDDFDRLFEEHGGRYGGGRLYCPFHDDKTPSAEIWEDRFHCWTCDIRLDVFDFVMRAQRVDFKHALAYLAARYNVPLTSRRLTHTEVLKQKRINAAAKIEAVELVAWRVRMDAALRELRDRYFVNYHRGLQLILKHSLLHPRAGLWADITESCERGYVRMDRYLAVLARAHWDDLLVLFRERRTQQ